MAHPTPHPAPAVAGAYAYGAGPPARFALVAFPLRPLARRLLRPAVLDLPGPRPPRTRLGRRRYGSDAVP